MSDQSDRFDIALSQKYVIERELGAGGMARVFLARDVQHHRKVAIKVLRPELSLAADRFLLEIRVTASLQHPGIVPLFDSGEADGLLYYVMPFIEGESLRQRLDREARLDVDVALKIARDVASVLAYAHEQNVVHRDIKPENIMLSRDQALVADFGIARAVSAAGNERMTATGSFVGTPAYMSPEQALAEKTIDGRSDIYSLGCVVYEMISGENPFAAPSMQETIARRLTQPAPMLTSVPAAVASAVGRALAAQPGDRFTSALELAHALMTPPVSGAPLTDVSSIVVLPLENLSPDPENAYFADGLTEEIISDLSQINDLRVISRTSAMRYRDSDKDLPTIARELNVQYVLEGSVRRAGQAIRVTAQLIEARSDAHLWSAKFGGSTEDVFEIQERISREIVAALKLTLSPEETERISARRVNDPAVFDLFLRVRHEVMQGTSTALDRARTLVEHATDLVSESALLLSLRATVLFQSVNLGLTTDHGMIEDAVALARRALSIDPECLQAQLILAWILSRVQMREAYEIVRTAKTQHPYDVDALMMWIWLTIYTGATPLTELDDDAEELLRRDPLNGSNYNAVGTLYWWRGDYAAGLEASQRAARIDPVPMIQLTPALILVSLGRTQDALPEFESIGSYPDENCWVRLARAWAHALRSDIDEVNVAIDQTVKEWASSDCMYSWYLAQIFAQTPDQERAIDWAERAVNNQLTNYPFLAKHDRLVDSLREHPRFVGLLRRVKTDSVLDS